MESAPKPVRPVIMGTPTTENAQNVTPNALSVLMEDLIIAQLVILTISTTQRRTNVCLSAQTVSMETQMENVNSAKEIVRPAKTDP